MSPRLRTSTISAVIATRSARLADVEADDRAVPRRLAIGAIQIATAPIDPVGVNGDGTMEIPTDIRRIGWYEYGASPGEGDGSAVLTAHIDSRRRAKGCSTTSMPSHPATRWRSR